MSSIAFQVHAAGHDLRVMQIQMTKAPASSPSPVLVFLHEGLGCIEMWRDFPDKLCARTGCDGLLYDRKGYGGSSNIDAAWPMDYLMEEANRDLPAVLEACKTEKVILIGHSDGGTIALLAAALPELKHRIVGVVTIAAHVFVEDETVRGIRNFMDKYQDKNLKSKLNKYHGINSDKIVYRWARRWLDPDFKNWNMENFLPDITCPSLVIQGTRDEYATQKQVERIVQKVTGKTTHKMIADCGHQPHLESSEQTLKATVKFIRALCG